MKVLLVGTPYNRNQWAAFDWLTSRQFNRDGKGELIVNTKGPTTSVDKLDRAVQGMMEEWKSRTLSDYKDPTTKLPSVPKLSTTMTPAQGIINWTPDDQRGLPIWPIPADVVFVLTNPQYNRQIKNNPNKLKWTQWYQNRGSFVIVVGPNGIFSSP